MRRRQIYSQRTRDAEKEFLTIKEHSEVKNNDNQKNGKVVCCNCNKLFDNRGYNVHRRTCK